MGVSTRKEIACSIVPVHPWVRPSGVGYLKGLALRAAKCARAHWSS